MFCFSKVFAFRYKKNENFSVIHGYLQRKLAKKFKMILFLFLGKSFSPPWRNFASGSHTKNSQKDCS